MMVSRDLILPYKSGLSIPTQSWYNQTMFNPNRGGNRFGGGGGRDFRRPSFGGGGGGSFDRPEMHKTVCSKCGNDCEVPFRPTGAKPVYCNNCFRSMRDSEPRRFDDRNSRGPSNAPSEDYKKQFESLNWKLDKILKILAPAPIVSSEKQPEVAVEKKAAKPPKQKKPVKV